MDNILGRSGKVIFTFENGSCNSNQIAYVKATFSEDRENVNGVCRIMYVEIECDNDVPHEIKSKVETEIFNHFAGNDYIDEESSWKEAAANDIRNYVGVSNVDVDWE